MPYTFNRSLPRPNPIPARQTPTPAVNIPVPMDVDAAHSRARKLDLCYRCGEPGHRAGACPHHQDIRMLTPKGRDELLQDLLVLVDVEEAKDQVAEEIKLEVVEEARAALAKAKDDMARFYNQRHSPTPQYKVGD